MFFDGFQSILGTAGIEAAVVTQQGAHQIAISMDNRCQNFAHGLFSCVGSPGWLASGLSDFVRSPLQLLPQFAKHAVHGTVVQLIEPLPCQEDGIDSIQLMLVQTEALSGDPLNAISLHREFGIFFGNYQAQPGVRFIVWPGQKKNLRSGYFKSGVIKNRFVVR